MSIATSGAQALDLVGKQLYDVMICDIRLPGIDGLTLFRRTRQESPETTVILMTAFAAVQDAVAAVKEGAHDYLTKPFDIDELNLRVRRIAEHRALLRELEEARAQLAGQNASETVIGRSSQMLRLMDRVNTIATSHAAGADPGGERHRQGAGRARAARARSPAAATRSWPSTARPSPRRCSRRSCSDTNGRLHRGDAAARRAVQAAHGGTLLLDEVAEMSPAAQAKLLRVLQEGTVEPLGTNESLRVDVRVISATHRDLKERIADGSFRRTSTTGSTSSMSTSPRCATDGAICRSWCSTS